MKKAKIMLAAIAVLAIAGGVYASKAKDASLVVYTHKVGDPATLCTITRAGITTVPNDFPIVLSATTTTILPCVSKTFFTTD